MANKSVTLLIRIAGEDAGASRAVRGTRQEVRGLSQEMSNFKVQAGSAFAAYKGYDTLNQTAQAASSLIEAQNTAEQVFGESLQTVRAFGEGAVDSIGLSERAALQATNQYGALLQNLGYTEQEAARAGMSLTALASDLAAAWDRPVEEALVALRSGIAGEMEPLKGFGVLLTDARMRQEALNQGIYDGTGILSASQRAHAALALIMQDSSKAQGQYAREADGLAQRQQRSNAELENAKASFGEGILPLMKALASAVGAVAGAYESLPEPAQRVVSATTAVGVGLAGLTFVAGTAWPAIKAGAGIIGRLGVAARAAALDLIVPRSAIQGLGSEAVSTSGGLRKMLTSLGPAAVGGAVVGIGLVAAAIAQMQIDSARTERNVQSLRAGLESGLTPIENMTDKLAKTLSDSDGGFEGLAGSSKLLARDLEELGVAVPDLAKLLVGSDADWTAFENRIGRAFDLTEERAQAVADGTISRDMLTDEEVRYQRIIDNLRGFRGEGDKAVTSFETYKATMRDAGIEVDDATGAIIENAGALGEQETAAERAASVLEEYLDRARAIRDAEVAVVDAHRESVDAQADLAEARRAAAGDSEEYLSAVEAIGDAERAVVDAQEGVVDANREVSDAQRDLNDAREAARDRLVEYEEAVRSAALAEADATLRVKEARQELERTLRDPRSSALERERAQLDVRQAEEEARQATSDRTQAEADNEAAKRRGIEGDDAVVRARQRVADANDRVTDAERALADARDGVADAEKRASKIITDARAEVEAAQRRAEDAALDEAKAWGELRGAQDGAVAGAQAYLTALTDLEAKLDPNAPLRQRIQALREDLLGALGAAAMADGGTGIPGYRYPDQFPGAGGNGVAGGGAPVPGVPVGNSVTLNQTVVVQGTPANQRRALRDSTSDALDGAARRGRG